MDSNGRPVSTSRFSHYGKAFCFWLLGTCVLFCAASAWRGAASLSEHAQGSDPFGYLLGAQQIRQAFASHSYPTFSVQTEQSYALIEHLKSARIPLVEWEELVGPPTTHYMPRSNQVGIQYPPGTALALACFPQGQAARDFTRLTLATLTALAALGLIVASRRGSLLAAMAIVLTAVFAMRILDDIAECSFSIDVLFLPLSLTFVMTAWAGHLASTGYRRGAWLIALTAGLFGGASILVRVASVILLPGLALCLITPDRTRWRSLRGPLAPWILGVMMTGFLPLAIYQHRVAGAWFESTYSRYDRGAPGIRCIADNVRFYFIDNDFSAANTIVFSIAIASVIALAGLASRRAYAPKFFLAAIIVWTGSTVFFLTHYTTIAYYMLPGAFASAALLAIGMISRPRRPEKMVPPRRSAVILNVVAGLILSTLLAFQAKSAWNFYRSRDAWNAAADDAPITAELRDPRAWIWAEGTAGTLWYYDQKPAMKIAYGSDAAKLAAYQFAFDHGDPQFIINDDAQTPKRMAQIVQWGGRLDPRGTFDHCPYFKITWLHRPVIQ